MYFVHKYDTTKVGYKYFTKHATGLLLQKNTYNLYGLDVKIQRVVRQANR